jgi:succinate dehydrogenase / fumarate reductase cytochrome b subunit
MAVTGFLMFGFVIVHMIGNLQVFLPIHPDEPHALDEYAAFLDETAHGALKWGNRVLLLVALVLHIRAFRLLAVRAGAARPQDYAGRQNLASTLMSRTMRISGPILFVFIVFHLLHFTVGIDAISAYEYGKVYDNVKAGFSNPVLVAVYVVAMLALGPHLAHGGYSMFRSLGLSDRGTAELARNVAIGLAALVTVANISIPIFVFAVLR